MKCPNCKIDLVNRPMDPPGMVRCPKCPFATLPSDKKADYLYAVLAVDKNGMEGICASKQFGMPMAMVAIRKELLEPMVTTEFKMDAAVSGMDIVIGKFKRCN